MRQDLSQAAKWYRTAADMGFPNSQYYLGKLYEAGRGVPQSYADAIRFYEMARQSQWKPRDWKAWTLATFALGQLYLNGSGVPQNDLQAFTLFQESAKHEHVDSVAMLGWMFENGRGVAKDLTQAISWYQTAAQAGNEYSIKRLKELGVNQ